VGTLFRIFPQTPTNEDSMPAEIIEVSSPLHSMGPGPSDDRMKVIVPVGKPRAYGMHKDKNGYPYVYLPPWEGAVYEPAVPDEDGNFLQYDDIDDPRFHATHTYASIRFTLDVWEKYYGRTIEWYFKDYYDKAEVVIIPDFENAQIGRGFIEIGADVNDEDGTISPFTLNFDVISHEVGHGILFSEIGEPDADKETSEFLGFQESGADIISMISILHFDSVIDEVLELTSGNLYLANHLNRFAETSSVEQIRMASNSSKLSEFTNGWKDSHKLAQPLTGAIFDILVDIFHEELVRVGAISANLEQISDLLEGSEEYGEQLQDDFDLAYATHAELFRESLIYARDVLATLLIETWERLSPNYLHYTGIEQAMLNADRAVFDSLYADIIKVNFKWRDIGSAKVGPRLPKDKSDGPDHGGHKGKKHKMNGLNENLSDQKDNRDDVINEPNYRGPRRKSYAKRYREARACE
jgi:hypothetical protein